MDLDDREACYRAVKSRDRRFDGVFYVAVRTTGIYCRPSCPARTPYLANLTFHRTAAGAQAAGYRACKRCVPDATPGSPDWDLTADLAGRAMRLIADGVVEREGVEGLSRRLGYSPRHVTRLLRAELGAGPLSLARARRAQNARTLLETSDLGAADIAFASGFSSVRQFNDTMREVYATTPTRLRGRVHGVRADGELVVRIAVRAPFASDALSDFLAAHLVPGVEAAGPGWWARTLSLPHGPGSVRLELPPPARDTGTAFVRARLRLHDLRDLGAAVERCRRVLDADCDPVAVDDALAADLAPLVSRLPGLRVPGCVDGEEMAVRTVLGQQVSVKAGLAAAARLAREYGVPVADLGEGLTHLFPGSAVLATLDPALLPMPRSRGRAVVALAAALAAGELALDRSQDRRSVRAGLLALPGVGPWTADHIALRGLGDPDVFLPSDLGVRRVLTHVPDPGAHAERWRPWRSYALMHLWTTIITPRAGEEGVTGVDLV